MEVSNETLALIKGWHELVSLKTRFLVAREVGFCAFYGAHYWMPLSETFEKSLMKKLSLS